MPLATGEVPNAKLTSRMLSKINVKKVFKFLQGKSENQDLVQEKQLK